MLFQPNVKTFIHHLAFYVMGHPYMLKGISSVLQKLERTAQRDCSDTTLWDPMTTSPHTGTV